MNAHFEAEIAFPPAEYRRQLSVDLLQYRPDLRFPFDAKNLVGAYLHRCGSEQGDAQNVDPGETVQVEVTLRAWDHVSSQVAVGTTFTIHEGRTTATGVVTRLIPEDAPN
ncbi:MAG: hypothetical protein M3N19_07325 [Candidatus Eremiobacteraeota bacterium]|nr:hypothetical protein [Candidatus Eremiobacteraeota bacterium]